MNSWERRAPARQNTIDTLQEENSLAGARRSQDKRSHEYGWHSRGYIPHFENPYAIQHVTYRLADTLPKDVLRRMDAELDMLPEEMRIVERRRRIEALMDAGYGSCILRNESAACCMLETWFRFDGERYRLLAFVVMPNHCHVLIECLEGFPLWKTVNSWKSYTARWINGHVALSPVEQAALGRDALNSHRRRLWQRDYWDRYIRNEQHFNAAKYYIENNPVTAGLVQVPEDWPWSSAVRERRAPARQNS